MSNWGWVGIWFILWASCCEARSCVSCCWIFWLGLTGRRVFCACCNWYWIKAFWADKLGTILIIGWKTGFWRPAFAKSRFIGVAKAFATLLGSSVLTGNARCSLFISTLISGFVSSVLLVSLLIFIMVDFSAPLTFFLFEEASSSSWRGFSALDLLFLEISSRYADSWWDSGCVSEETEESMFMSPFEVFFTTGVGFGRSFFVVLPSRLYIWQIDFAVE